MRTTHFLTVLLVFFFPIAARLAHAAPAGPAGTIQGTVTDTANAILPGATVKLDQGTATVTSNLRPRMEHAANAIHKRMEELLKDEHAGSISERVALRNALTTLGSPREFRDVSYAGRR